MHEIWIMSWLTNAIKCEPDGDLHNRSKRRSRSSWSSDKGDNTSQTILITSNLQKSLTQKVSVYKSFLFILSCY